MNNKTTQWATGKIESVAKDIINNGGLGVAAKREIEEIATAIIVDDFLFQNISKRLKGTGARTNIITHTGRAGWKSLDKNAWREFGFNQAPSILTENLTVTERIETSMEWNEADILDTEGGYEKIVDILKNALTVELPIVFEKLVLSKLKDVAKNGVTLVSDDILDNEATYPTATGFGLATSFDTVEDTQESITAMINLSNKMGQQENPLVYRPTKDKFMWVMNLETHSKILQAGGFKEFLGDDAWKRALNNDSVDMLNNIPVYVSNALGDDQPWYLIPRPDANLNGTQFMFFNAPDHIYSRDDFQGESASNRFFKMETSEFAVNVSYWAVKMGLFAYGTTGASYEAGFTVENADDGTATVTYSATALATDMVLVDTKNYIEYPQEITADGTEQTLELTGLATGSYHIQMRDAAGFNLYTTATQYIRNKGTEGGTNQETSTFITANGKRVESTNVKKSIVKTLSEKDIDKIVAKAKAEARAELEAEAAEKPKKPSKGN